MLIDILNNTDTISVRLPLDNDNQDYNYYCTINKRNNCKDLWEIQIEIGTKDNKNKINSIDIFTLITVPQMDGNSNE